MIHGIDKHYVKVNLTVLTKLNLFKELENQIEQKTNKETKINKLGDQISI